MRQLLPPLLLLVFLNAAGAEPIGWIERYVLADDKSEPLAELVPGTRDHFYFHILHDQTTGDLASAEKRLKLWDKSSRVVDRDGYQELRTRQRLLAYETDPAGTVAYLIEESGVRLDDPPPGGRSESYPTRLTDAELARQWRWDRNARDWTATGVRRFATRYLKDGQLPGGESVVRLAERIDFPLPGLDRIVIDAWQAAGQPSNFGQLAAHRHLTGPQLATVGKEIAVYATDQDFVDAVLTRLQPAVTDDDTSLRVQRPHARRVVDYVGALPSAFDELKSLSIRRLLELDAQAGEHDLDLFLAYLKLPNAGPRPLPWRIGKTSRSNPAAPTSIAAAGLDRIGDPEPLVVDYLHHFLRTRSPDVFAPYIRAAELGRIAAEARLLYGKDSPADAPRLSAEAIAELTDRVEIRLSPTNPRQLVADGPAELAVELKNTPRLDVRVYRLDAAAVLANPDREIDTDLSLAGLLPTEALTLQFDQPPIRRHAETISLPMIEGRGTWVVDLVSGRVRSRAILRRGGLRVVQRTTPDGIRLTVIDESRRPLSGQSVTAAGRRFETGPDGTVTLPHVSDSVDRQIVVGDGAVARRIELNQPGERYELLAAMHFDPVVAGSGTGVLLIRPELRLDHHSVARSVAESWSVAIRSTDADGNVSTRRFDDLDNRDGEPLRVEFTVGPQIRSVAAELTATVRRLSDGEVQTLRTGRNWPIAQSLAGDAVDDAYLTHDGKTYGLQTRGRTGEPVPGAVVELELTSDLIDQTLQIRVQTDRTGRAAIGTLRDVAMLQYGRPGGPEHRWEPPLEAADWPATIQDAAADPVRLPIAGPVDDRRFAAFEMIAGSPTTDVSDALTTADGLVSLTAGKPGEYLVIDLADDRQCRVTLVDGPVIDEVAVGEVVTATRGPRPPVSIASTEVENDRLKIQLSGNVDESTVLIVATRFLANGPAYASLRLPGVGLDRRTNATAGFGVRFGRRDRR